MQEVFQHRTFSKKKEKKWWFLIVLFCAFVIFLFVFFHGSQTYFFEPWTEIVVTKNNSLNVLYPYFSFPQKLMFKYYVKQHPESFSTLLEGTYLFSGEYTAETILSHFNEGPEKEYVKVRILEWWSIYDIDEYLSSKGFLDEWVYLEYVTNPEKIAALSERYEFFDASLPSLEGFLYPDTYNIDLKQDFLKTLVSIQLNTFKNKVRTPYRSDFYALSSQYGLSVYDAVILASVVEKEEKNSDNKPTVAGIFYHRLQKGIELWADITLCYYFKKPYSSCTPSLISKEIYNDKNPYNTRKKTGLMPTPIANPDVDTFKAILHPQKTKYLFYLHDSSGKIHYAETNEEHVKNKNQYL